MKYAHERSPSIDQITETPFQATNAAKKPSATTASRENEGRGRPARAPTTTAVATDSAAMPIHTSRPPDDPDGEQRRDRRQGPAGTEQQPSRPAIQRPEHQRGRLTSGQVESCVYKLLTRGSPSRLRWVRRLRRPQAPHRMRIRPAAITLALLALVAGLAAAALPSSAAAAGEAVLGARDRRLARQRHDRQALQGGLLPAGAEARAGGPARLLEHHRRDLGCVERHAPRRLGATATAPSGGRLELGDGDNTQAGKNRAVQARPSQSYYRRAIDNLGTTNANSLPIPLLVLAALGTLLLLSAGGLAASKRLKARRPGPPR